MMSLIRLPAWGQDQAKPFHMIMDGKTINPGCIAPLDVGADLGNQMLLKCPDLPAVKERKAYDAAHANDPRFHPKPVVVGFTTKTRPTLCGQIDALPKDTVFTAWQTHVSRYCKPSSNEASPQTDEACGLEAPLDGS